MKEVNPLKALRVRSGLTMQEVATFANVSRQYAVRSEQAVFSNMPASYAEALLSLSGGDFDFEELAAEYENWQHLRREESYGSLNLSFDFHIHDLDGDEDISLPQHPFTHWRMHSGIPARITVSKLFCVHPALIFKFEEQPWLCTTPPHELVAALKQAGYHPDLLLNFQNAYQVFRAARRQLANPA